MTQMLHNAVSWLPFSAAAVRYVFPSGGGGGMQFNMYHQVFLRVGDEKA